MKQPPSDASSPVSSPHDAADFEAARGAFATALRNLGDGLQQVDQAMRHQLSSDGELIAAIGDHVVSAGGKRVRPALLMLSAALCGYTGPRRVQVAAAVELLHSATLLHDDVVDLSPLRRGRPSANAVWGNRRAVLVGDYCYARASSMIVEDGDPEILWIFSNTIRLMSEGELLQLQRSFDPSVNEGHYYAVIDRKSASLLSAACEAGAILGGVTRAERRRVADFGRELGLAFQLRDDALDYEAGESELGKRPCADVREGKVTLPLLLALKRCTPAERECVVKVLKSAAREAAERGVFDEDSRESEVDLSPIVDVVARCRGVEDTVRRAHEHVERAAAAIAPFPASEIKAALLGAAQYAAARDR